MNQHLIVVAGGTGNLGARIITALRSRQVEVRALVRAGTDLSKTESLSQKGAQVIQVDWQDVHSIAEACKGATCVVSALAGLEDVILGTQKNLLDAAVMAGVPRFIPSDYSLDFIAFKDGENRNLDLRRKFHAYLDQQKIAATSIFNGAFMELLTNDMPMILVKQKLVIYWGNANQKMGFTSLDNTAAYTASVALDSESPRYLRIAGDFITPKEIQSVVNELAPVKFRLLKTGGLGLLSFLIRVAKTMAPGKTELYPAWQGMQYMRNMMDKRCPVLGDDNKRYPDLKWTSVKELISAHGLVSAQN